ncbi:MAG TPA: FAD-dependent oxidoreductase, partial [Friedmanniella sp.]
MDPVVVVGAGISGVAAARALTDGGREVVVLDRGRRVGGRMASRRTDGRVVDTGASYFTVSDDRFAAVVEGWRARGLARAWTDTLVAAHEGDFTPKTGPVRWAAAGGLRSLVEDLATGLDVRRETVERVGPGPAVDDLPATAVVLAMPDPQAVRLLDPAYAALAARLDDPFDPVLALTATWSERSWPDVQGAFVAGDPVLTWVADDGRRRGDGAPVLVAHSTAEFAA